MESKDDPASPSRRCQAHNAELQWQQGDKYISGWIEHHIEDYALLESILGNTITEIRPTDWPTYKAARFCNVPVAVLDKLAPLWGQFEWAVDEE